MVFVCLSESVYEEALTYTQMIGVVQTGLFSIGNIPVCFCLFESRRPETAPNMSILLSWPTYFKHLTTNINPLVQTECAWDGGAGSDEGLESSRRAYLGYRLSAVLKSMALNIVEVVRGKGASLFFVCP